MSSCVHFSRFTQGNLFSGTSNKKKKKRRKVRMYLWWSRMEFTYFVFTRMPGESYRRRLMSLLLCLCYAFRALINCDRPSYVLIAGGDRYTLCFLCGLHICPHTCIVFVNRSVRGSLRGTCFPATISAPQAGNRQQQPILHPGL